MYVDKLKQLVSAMDTHPIFSGDFFSLWIVRGLFAPQIKILAENYYAFTQSFPDVLATLFLNLDDAVSKNEILQTLHSEMGFGNQEKFHFKLFSYCLSSLYSRVTDGKILTIGEPLATTTNLIQGEKGLYGDTNRAQAAGAQVFLEHFAYPMLCYLYEGMRTYIGHWSHIVTFHEDMEFFYAHIGAVEKDHKLQALNACMPYLNRKDFRSVLKGFNAHEKLMGAFYQGIYNAMKEVS